MTDHLLALCAVPDRDTGQRLARALVEERLAACVNLVPGIASVYRWQGTVEESTECLLLIKTRAALFAALRDRIVALHPYELPEVIGVPVKAGLSAYLNWINENTTD